MIDYIKVPLLTGLTAGGISCFMVQGGLLAVALTKQENKRLSIYLFLTAKIFVYTVLGLILGYIGSKILITPKLQGFMQIFAGFVMLFAVGKLLNLHPVFSKITFTPPKSIYKLLRIESNKSGLFTPFILGIFTVLIPCGITQSMMIYSVSSNNPVTGSLILFVYTLGTIPYFIIFGLLSSKMFSDVKFRYVGSLILVILAIISINTGQNLRGSIHTLQNYSQALLGENKTTGSVAGLYNGIQEVTINVDDYGYSTGTNILKIGIPVSLTLVTNNVVSCSSVFTIPEYNIYEVLPKTGEVKLEFTPQQLGKLTYTCGMGMYSGSFNVVN